MGQDRPRKDLRRRLIFAAAGWLRVNDIVKLASGAPVIWGFLRDDGTPAAYIHKCFRREVWREAGPGEQVALCLASLLWPLVLLGLSGFCTRRMGSKVKERTGKGILRQIAEQMMLGVTLSVLPPWYYILELHDDDKRRRAKAYLYRFEIKAALYVFLRKYRGGLPSSSEFLSDKALFVARCRDHGVAAVPVVLVVEKGTISAPDGGAPLPPASDLFVKAKRGAGGRDAVRWRYLDDGSYRDHEGRVLSRDALAAHLRTISLKASYVVRPNVANHPAIADLSTGALNTVRVVTCRNETGAFEATNALLRMARGRGTVVDNMHAGGIGAKVDIATGTLGRATDMGMSRASGWWARHPDTGAPIAGRTLPFWAEVLDLVGRAHAAFPDQPAIGWDVALTAEGPCLVEGNKSPDLDIVQRTHEAPLGNARFGQLFAFNLARALAAKYGHRARPPVRPALES